MLCYGSILANFEPGVNYAKIKINISFLKVIHRKTKNQPWGLNLIG